MLRALLLLMLVAVPWVRADETEEIVYSREAPLIGVGRAYTVYDHVMFPSSGSARVSTVGADVNPDPNTRSNGNLYAQEDFNYCNDGTALGGPVDLNDFYFSTSNDAGGAQFKCSDENYGRIPASNSVQLYKPSSLTGTVTYSISKIVQMRTNGVQASINFMIYRRGASSAITTTLTKRSGVTGQLALNYRLTDTASSFTPVTFTLVRLNPSEGISSQGIVLSGWQSYVAYFTLGNVADADIPKSVEFQLEFTRDAETDVLMDDVNIRLYRYIQDPAGRWLINQKFDVCESLPSDATTTSLENALNAEPELPTHTPAVVASNPWDLDEGVVCEATTFASASRSAKVATSEEVTRDDPFRRSITRIVDVTLTPGREVTLDFWVRWEADPAPENEFVDSSPTLALGVQIDMGDANFRDGGISGFTGHFLPGPRPVQTSTDSETNDFFRYRSVYTLPVNIPGGESRNVKFLLVFQYVSIQDGPFYSGTYWVDDIQLRYTDSDDINTVVGDPQFVGLYNQNYQVHGIDGGVYNLVSSPTTQVNSRFVFLSEGKCPIFDGIPARNCFAHPGSYLGAIGIQEVVDGVTHKLTIVSGPANTGFASIELDGMKLSVNDSVAHGTTFDVNFVTSHVVMVNTADFAFTFENSDMFVNQGVAAHRPLSQLTSHGLFGQTHKRVIYPSKLKYIEGEVDDYLIAEDDLFGRDFVYNQFHS